MKNIRLDVNGSDDKIFPQEENFNFNVEATWPTGKGEYMPSVEKGTQLGQIKYARREGARSIYKDETRETANDLTASAKAEGSVMGCDMADEAAEESQGI